MEDGGTRAGDGKMMWQQEQEKAERGGNGRGWLRQQQQPPNPNPLAEHLGAAGSCPAVPPICGSGLEAYDGSLAFMLLQRHLCCPNASSASTGLK